jgi:hypothetical protein
MNMKSIKIYLPLALLVIGMSTACKKYIDVDNPDSLVDPTFWKNENNVRAYNWEFYNLFMGFGNGSSLNGDFYYPSITDDQVPASLTLFPKAAATTNGDWFFGYIRKADIMLERIDAVPMADEAKNHWKGVARFFRALQYFKLVQEFGDVPWYSHSLDISDSAEIYKLRDPHQLVMDSVLADINFAVDNVRIADQTNTVNKFVVLALKSRICLWEGTFRKYWKDKNMPDQDKWLQQAKDAANIIMTTGGYALAASYQTAYNSNDLSTDKEMILYKRYEATFLTHSLIAYLYSSTPTAGPSKSAVESYLCSDGLPIGLSPLYQGDSSISRVFANRDKRLGITIDSTWYYYDGHSKNGLTASSGYRPIKFLPDSNTLRTIQTGIGTNLTDAPLFWLAEVYLNYAEAAVELDKDGQYTLTQADLDASINKLRDRAGVAHLTLAGPQDPGFTDPNKDPDADISSLIWEIRRERRVELLMDGFRFNDLLRWKKGPYLDYSVNPNAMLGCRITPGSNTDGSGYVLRYPPGSLRPFIDPKNYLTAIPTTQILLYPASIQASMQNPGW